MHKPSVLRGTASALLCILALSGTAHAAERFSRIGERTVYELSPGNPRYEQAPVVIFSADFGVCPDAYRELLFPLATKGFRVFSPVHADAKCRDQHHAGGPARVEAVFQYPQLWKEDTYAGRRDDLIAVLDALRNDPERRRDLNLSQIALAGHIVGGYVVLGMGGARPGWKESWNSEGVKAIAAFSPYTAPYNLMENAWSDFHFPLMLQLAERDRSATHITNPEKGAYAKIKTPKYLISLKSAGINSWLNPDAKVRDPINRYTLAFLSHYLTGEASPILTTGGSSLSLFGYESELGSVALRSPRPSTYGTKGPTMATTPGSEWRSEEGRHSPYDTE